MNKAERAELIKWWDALDLLFTHSERDTEGIQMARECQHPDAQWLASLFPPDENVKREHLLSVMLAQGNDPRALYIAWKVGNRRTEELLLRAAEMGYAPAQAGLVHFMLHDGESAFRWAERSAAQLDREGLFRLARCLHRGMGCPRDKLRAVKLLVGARGGARIERRCRV
jgi:TPR repeat protein